MKDIFQAYNFMLRVIFCIAWICTLPFIIRDLINHPMGILIAFAFLWLGLGIWVFTAVIKEIKKKKS